MRETHRQLFQAFGASPFRPWFDWLTTLRELEGHSMGLYLGGHHPIRSDFSFESRV
jgi:hypothetical protein